MPLPAALARRLDRLAGGARARDRAATALHAALLALTVWHVVVTVSGHYANRFFLHDVGTLDYRLYFSYQGRLLWDLSHDAPSWTVHFQPSLLALAPLHAVFRHVLFLPLLETLAVCSCGWAVAWMLGGALRRGGGGAFPPLGLALGWLCVCHPLAGSMILANHYDSITMAAMAWALAALLNGRAWLFWALAFFSAGFKEDGGLYWLGLGLWWIAFGWEHRGAWRRRLPRGLSLVVFGALWTGLGLAVVSWARRHHGASDFFFSDRAAWLGDSPLEALGTVLSHPVLLFGTPLRLGWIVLWPLLGLPLAAPATLLLLLPGAYVMGLSSGPQRWLAYYYAYPLLPFAFLGAALGAARLARGFRRARGPLLLLCVLGGAALLPLPTRTDGLRRVPFEVTERHRLMRAVLHERLPRRASVAAQFDLFCQVPHRPNILPLTPETLSRCEYWALDLRGRPGDQAGAPWREILHRVSRALETGQARIVFEHDGFLLLRRQGEDREGGALRRRADD